MFQSAARIGAVMALAAVATSALAQGVGVPPPNQGQYTPSYYGNAQLVSPLSPNYFSLKPQSQGCNWSESYGNGSSQNYAYPESNAVYWQAISPLVNAAGTRIRIDGQVPNARFFSITIYNGLYQVMGTLHDYDLVTQGGAKPYLSKTVPNPLVRYGDAYTAYIVFGPKPAQAEPNTYYVPPQLGGAIPGLPSVQKLIFLYRVYVPGGRTASGDVPLPGLSINGTPFSNLTDSAVCQSIPSQLQQNLLNSLPLTPGQPGLSAPTNPAFTLYKDMGIPGLDAGVNADNQYMSAKTTLPAGYLYLVRGKSPTYTSSPTVPAASVPDLRYWSICQNTGTSLQVIGCVGDFQALRDSGGFYNIVVSGGLVQQRYADAAHGFNWMPFGPQSPATVIYRQQLAADGFTGAAGSPTMGPYLPKIAYCTTSQFESLAQQFPTLPNKVFTGCGGGAD